MDENEDFGPMESADELSSLRARIVQLEAHEQELEKKLEQNEVDFGVKRAKFRELFLQKEAELTSFQTRGKELEEKAVAMEEKFNESVSELNDIKTAVAVSEMNKEEEIAKIRQQCQQEIETMQALLREAAEEASSSTAAQYETERATLQKLNKNYEEEIEQIRSKRSQDQNLDKKGFLSSMADIVHRGTASLNTGTSEAENLEVSMRRAQQDAEILKSVVLPLEEEIAKLQRRAQEQDEKVKSLEKQKSQLQERLVSLQPEDLQSPTKTTSLPSLDDIKDPDEKIEKLMKYLKAEKACRTDLEMYVAVINAQKNTLENDTDKIRNELKEVCNILSNEKREHGQLKETWQMANDQFLESQRLMMMDMRRMESLLSSEQQRQLTELKKKDREREIQEKKIQELQEMRLKQEQDSAKNTDDTDAENSLSEVSSKKMENKLIEQLVRGKSMSSTSVNSTASQDSLNFDDSLAETAGLTKSHSNLEICSMSEQDYINSSVQETRSLSEMDNLTIRISPEKVINLPSLTEAQVKSITDPTPETEARQHLLATVKSKSETLSLEGRRLVSDEVWNLLQQELKGAREKLGRPCDMCNNYEDQLQNVQDDMKSEQMKVRSLERELTAEKQTIGAQKNYIEELETSLKDAAVQADTEISNLVSKVQECEKYISEVRQQHNSSQVEMQDHLKGSRKPAFTAIVKLPNILSAVLESLKCEPIALKELTSTREEVQKELVRLQEENDSLVNKHSKNAQQMQNEDINLPNNLEDMQLLLLKYREDIIAAKVAQEQTLETLQSKILFLKDQVSSEQEEKTRIEEALTQEINSLQERLAIQDSLRTELERESAVRSETETKLRDVEQALKGQQAKSKQLINGLQKQVEEQSKARTKLENETTMMRGKIQSLQSDLDNSEAVQRDFVKLSQSLQIQLEQLRQAETEVRWENEEDVDECHNCKQQFSVTKRKHHCRHCGKIFCSDCNTKTVNSGPRQRPAKVCDVCHTILVKDATPYFSTDLPNTPD